MKKNTLLLTFSLILAGVTTGSLQAQNKHDHIRLWQNGKMIYTVPMDKVDSITFASSKTPDNPPENPNDLSKLSFTQASVSYFNSEDYLADLDPVDSVFMWANEKDEQVPLRAYLVDVTVNLFSDGFYINDNGEYAGAETGYIASFPGKAWYAPEGLNTDRGFESSATITTGVWSTQAKTQAKVLTAGTFTNGEEAFGHVQLAVDKFNEYIASDYADNDALEAFHDEMYTADTLAFHGARLIRLMYMPSYGSYSWDYMPAAVITAGAMQLEYNDKSYYMYSVPAAEMKILPLNGDNGWGVKVVQNEITSQYTLISKGFEFGEQFTYRHVPENKDAAPARIAKQFDKHILTGQPKNVVRR